MVDHERPSKLLNRRQFLQTAAAATGAAAYLLTEGLNAPAVTQAATNTNNDKHPQPPTIYPELGHYNFKELALNRREPVDYKTLFGDPDIQIAIGTQQHASRLANVELAENIPALSELGFTIIGMEMFHNDAGINELIIDYQNGHTKVRPQIAQYLEDHWGHFKITDRPELPDIIDGYISIIDAATDNGIQIIPLEPPSDFPNGLETSVRELYTANVALHNLESDSNSKLFLYVGNIHGQPLKSQFQEALGSTHVGPVVHFVSDDGYDREYENGIISNLLEAGDLSPDENRFMVRNPMRNPHGFEADAYIVRTNL